MKIVIDIDSTIAKTHDAVLKLYREMTGDFGTEVDDENLAWNMKDICRKWSQDEIDSVFANPRLFELFEPMEHTVEVLQKLHDEGHYLEICSVHRKEGVALKRDWVRKYFPMIDKITILPFEDFEKTKKFDKSSVKGDIIVDDRLDAVNSSKCRFKIVYGNYSWNRDWEGMRVTNWLDAYSAINSINHAIIRGDLTIE